MNQNKTYFNSNYLPYFLVTFFCLCNLKLESSEHEVCKLYIIRSQNPNDTLFNPSCYLHLRDLYSLKLD